ncbi:DUF1570 domain-containing protein [Dysgonomonas sp. 511]|uniref:peptidase MA family metallohydrolase n=1 Tax=Dysgonomonas sp. 511 TaxID=2302930 RepID=UPI0013D7B534|nr:DUF1570 domain-containing protein [Dysgonomonas sp. 511]NDV79388.1 DUF1570 domain-containing protein [Dysgonomonas sp. 511]
MRKIYIAFLLLLIADIACAQYAIKDNDKVLDKKEQKVLEQVISHQLEFYNKVLPDSAINSTDVRLVIFSKYGDYLMYQKEQTNTTHHRSMGFYSRKNKEAVVCKDRHENGFLSTCYHELSHFFVNTYFGSVPIWLNEGLAVYFGNTKAGKTVKHQPHNTFFMRVKTMVDTQDINIEEFLDWSHKQFSKKSFTHENYGYALGYSIVQFLMQKDPQIVINIIREIKDGKNSREAIEVSYGGGFSRFESDFFEYISKV